MISKRIKLIASLIKDDETVCDIGCDHGYLAWQLRKNGNKEKIYCVDNKVGPLNNARSNLIYFDNIEYELSDGATNLKQASDVVVLSGMGYHSVIDIITQSQEYFSQVKRLIVQVNNDVDKMRAWFNASGYEITNELIIHDYKYYQVLVLQKGKQELTDLEITYGPILLKKKDEVFRSYINWLIEKNKEIIKGIDENNPDYIVLKEKIEQLEQL